MTTIGVRELKAHLSEYLARAEAGEVIIVTHRGKRVAQLRAAPQNPEEAAWELVRAGLAEWNGKRLVPRRPAVAAAGASLADLILAEREEGAGRFGNAS